MSANLHASASEELGQANSTDEYLTGIASVTPPQNLTGTEGSGMEKEALGITGTDDQGTNGSSAVSSHGMENMQHEHSSLHDCPANPVHTKVSDTAPSMTQQEIYDLLSRALPLMVGSKTEEEVLAELAPELVGKKTIGGLINHLDPPIQRQFLATSPELHAWLNEMTSMKVMELITYNLYSDESFEKIISAIRRMRSAFRSIVDER